MSNDAAPLPDDLALCHQIIRELQQEVAELKARLNQNSSNSSKPPSSDAPSVKRAPLWWPSGSHLPCEMEVCTAKKSDIINRLPGIRVPGDEQFFGK